MAEPVTVAALRIRIPEVAARPVAEQLAARERLTAALRAALDGVPEAGRIVLDGSEGAAVVFLDSAAAAQRTACALRDHPASRELRLGLALNAGPLSVEATARTPSLIGDSLVALQAVAAFAKPGEVLATRAFRDAALAGDPALAVAFTAAGERTDNALRAHQLYRCTCAPPEVSGNRRRLVRALALSVGGLLAGGFSVRAVRHAIAARQMPAVLELAITPVGEVVVDGTVRGRTPPLKTLELAPGRHAVEVRSLGHPSLTVELDLKPGEQMVIRHAFGTREAPSRLRAFLKGLGL